MLKSCVPYVCSFIILLYFACRFYNTNDELEIEPCYESFDANIHEPIFDAKEEYYEVFPYNEIQGKVLQFIHEIPNFCGSHIRNHVHNAWCINTRLKPKTYSSTRC
jgi:hypothetical protein